MSAVDAVPPIDEPRVSAWVTANVADSVGPFSSNRSWRGSNLTFRVYDSAGHQWALRRPPMGQILATAHDMAREVRIMSALAPEPRARPGIAGYCDDLPSPVPLLPA